MKLIIDTSSSLMTVILVDDGKIFVAPKCDKKHQENLLPAVEKLLVDNKTSLENVDTIGVVIGPGSFTGIRLAVATAKAFCYADNIKKIVPINMLDLLGFVAKKSTRGDYCVYIKCTASKIYSAKFSKTGEKLSQFVLIKDEIEKFANIEKFYFNDDDFFAPYNLKKLEILNEDYVNFLEILVAKKIFESFDKLEPLYLALSEAEEELLKKEKNNG